MGDDSGTGMVMEDGRCRWLGSGRGEDGDGGGTGSAMEDEGGGGSREKKERMRKRGTVRVEWRGKTGGRRGKKKRGWSDRWRTERRLTYNVLSFGFCQRGTQFHGKIEER